MTNPAIKAARDAINDILRRDGIASLSMDLAEAAIAAYEAANGWLFVNPDTGIEYSEQHPIDSGEVPDAESIRPATASNLLPLLIEAWEETERYREAARRSAVAVNTASNRIKELEAEVVKLREALIDARDEYAGMRWGEDHEYREAGERVERIIDAALKESANDKE